MNFIPLIHSFTCIADYDHDDIHPHKYPFREENEVIYGIMKSSSLKR